MLIASPLSSERFSVRVSVRLFHRELHLGALSGKCNLQDTDPRLQPQAPMSRLEAAMTEVEAVCMKVKWLQAENAKLREAQPRWRPACASGVSR